MAIKTYLTNTEIQAMIDWAQFPRDKVILTFLGDVGCRVSELLEIKVEDIDFDRGEVLIPHLKHGIKKRCPSCGRAAGRFGKFCSRCGTDISSIEARGIKDRSRLVNIGEQTSNLLKKYTAGSSWKPSAKIIGITRQQVYNIIREAALAIGLKGKVILNPETGKKHYPHPHNFRDSLAVDWLSMAGGDINKQKALQMHLGHQSFDSTMRYAKLTPGTVKKVSDQVRKARFGKKEV